MNASKSKPFFPPAKAESPKNHVHASFDLSHSSADTERLFLRVCNEQIADRVLEYHERNREHFLSAGSAVDGVFFTIDYQRMRLRQEWEQAVAGNAIRLWMFKKEEPTEIIGDVKVSGIVRWNQQSCVLGYKIDRGEEGKGYMSEALAATIRFLFEELKLNRIEASIMPRNVPSQRVIEKLGFQQEGLSRKFMKVAGVWEDHLRYALLNEMFEG